MAPNSFPPHFFPPHSALFLGYIFAPGRSAQWMDRSASGGSGQFPVSGIHLRNPGLHFGMTRGFGRIYQTMPAISTLTSSRTFGRGDTNNWRLLLVLWIG